MIKTYRPTSPGMRGRKSLVKNVSSKRPLKKLTVPLKGPAGRNKGKISSRHRQRGARKHYRLVDFKRDKVNIPAKVVRIEHDPNRGPNIALLSYADGEKRYILAPEGLKAGMTVISGDSTEISVGNAMRLVNMPLGMEIHNIELYPGGGGQMVRGAGNSAVVLAKEGKYANIKLPSGEVKKVLSQCFATIGKLGNADLRNVNLGKAGRKRHLGWRPHTRGVAFSSPRDHPHGGSYKDTGIGMPSPKSPWGWKTRGKKTRRRKHTDKFIVTRKQKRR
jgi:large subunit ribosomal protein L2